MFYVIHDSLSRFISSHGDEIWHKSFFTDSQYLVEIHVGELLFTGKSKFKEIAGKKALFELFIHLAKTGVPFLNRVFSPELIPIKRFLVSNFHLSDDITSPPMLVTCNGTTSIPVTLPANYVIPQYHVTGDHLVRIITQIFLTGEDVPDLITPEFLDLKV